MKKIVPLVSVIMPVYNGAPYVGKAIESIITQTYPRLELLIVDNRSSDATFSIIHDYKKRYPKRIKLYTYKKEQGAFFAANCALTKARGRYIAMMDADDIAHKQRIEKQVAYFQSHPGTIVLGTQAMVIDRRGRTIGKKSVPLDQEAIYKQFGVVHPMVHPSVMINRAMLPDPSTLYFCKYGVNDDYYTFFRLFQYGAFANLPEALLKYRVHEENSSLTNLKQHFWTITKIRIEAITKLNYQAPFYVFPVMIAQTIIVSILPETWLKELFYYIRGIKKVTIAKTLHLSGVKAHLTGVHAHITKLKSYATTFLA